MATRTSMVDRLHKMLVLVCFGTTIYGTGVIGYRFTQYLLHGTAHRRLEITNQEPTERVDPEKLSDGPNTRA